MKKVISLLVALATACSVSLAAFAADDTPGAVYAAENTTGTASATDNATRTTTEADNTTGTVNPANNTAGTTNPATPSTFAAEDTTGTDTDDNGVVFLPETGNTNTNLISPRINLVGTDNEYAVGAYELFLVEKSTRVVTGVYNRLAPDKEYVFRVYYNNSDTEIKAATGADLLGEASAVELTGATVGKGTVRVRTKKGSSYVQSARIRSVGRGDSTVYEFVLTTRAQYGTSMNDVQYILSVSGSTTGTFAESQHNFEVGWPRISDEDTEVGEDGVIVISNDAPVITKDQFSDISRSANYKNVTFEGEDGGWRYIGRTSGMGSTNFYYSYDVVPELINKFPDQDYKFLSFRGGVTFPTNGEMRIDVDELVGKVRNLYTYLYRGGKLTRIAHTIDTDSNEIVFRTNYLGTFVITDTEITDTSIIGEENVENNRENEREEEREEPIRGTENPSTGASSAMDLSVVLGLVALVSAGAISRKKK